MLGRGVDCNKFIGQFFYLCCTYMYTNSTPFHVTSSVVSSQLCEMRNILWTDCKPPSNLLMETCRLYGLFMLDIFTVADLTGSNDGHLQQYVYVLDFYPTYS